MFELKNDVFKDKKNLIFDKPSKEWAQVIHYYRHKKNLASLGSDMKKAKEKSDKLNELDYIFGPIADGNVMSSNPNPLGKDWQLCLKNKAMADAFYNDGKNVHLTIFFCD